MDFEGFSSLSAAELAAMRKAVDKLVSADGVQVLKDGSSIDKSLIHNNNALIVVDGKESVSLKLSGLGKGIRVYLMNISDAHNTVCFQMNGATASSQIAMTLKGDPKYVSRASADLNGNGSIKSYMKVLGGNQTGSSLKANSLKGRSVTMITEGKNDTFSSIAGNFIAGGEYNIKIKGKDDTGFGVDTGSIKDSKWNMEIQGEDNVSIMMNAKAVDGNDISGWIKAKSGAKMSAALNDVIDVMPVP